MIFSWEPALCTLLTQDQVVNRGQRESNFQVDTISILIVATIVDIDIEIDIDIINRRC